MKKLSAFFFFCLPLFLLTACGFTPIYGHHDGKAPVARALSFVAIDNIADRNGQYLRNKLIDRMYFHGRPSKPQTRLTVTLSFKETDLGIQKDSTASRSQLVLWAKFVLKDMDGKVLLDRSAHSIASYNKIDAQYGLLVTQRNAYERTLDEAAEQIVNAVSLYFAEREKDRPANTPPSEPEKTGD